jgi:hypothetical protein
MCEPCDAHVGVHKGTDRPLGRLANKELREWKKRAHAAFDPLWTAKLLKRRRERGENYKKAWARGSGYAWLATKLSIDRSICHTGMFDVAMCRRVIEVYRSSKHLGQGTSA